MAGFDFVGAATAGYKFAWHNRAMIARYALPLFLIRFASFVIITSFNLDISILRQGLILLPSYFVEGWVLAVLIRFYMKTPHGDDTAPRAILAATLLYVLIKLFLSVTSGLAMASQPELAAGQEITEPNLGSFAAALIALLVMIWAFRMLWFYIPAAFNYPLGRFAERIAAYKTSFYMIGTWLICLLPPAFALLVFSQILMAGTPEGASPGAVYHFIMIATQAAVEIFIAVVSTIAMTEGIRAMLLDTPKKKLF